MPPLSRRCQPICVGRNTSSYPSVPIGVSGHRSYQLFTEPNEEQLFTCTPEGLSPEGTGAKRMAQYMDMRCGAAVGYTNSNGTPTTLVYGFPLEAVRNFESLYKHSIEWLMNQ